MKNHTMTVRVWSKMQVRDTAVALRQAGYTVDYRQGGHYICYADNGDLVFMAMGGRYNTVCRINTAYIELENRIPLLG